MKTKNLGSGKLPCENPGPVNRNRIFVRKSRQDLAAKLSNLRAQLEKEKDPEKKEKLEAIILNLEGTLSH